MCVCVRPAAVGAGEMANGRKVLRINLNYGYYLGNTKQFKSSA